MRFSIHRRYATLRQACGVRVHVLSDLHLERGGEPPAAVDADVVVLAGDIGRGVQGLRTAIGWWPGQRILYVAGNHEPYGHGLPGLIGELRIVASAANGRVSVLERDEVVIGGVRFLGCTLWSAFDVAGARERARAMAICGDLVNDYEHIAWTPQARTLRPQDTLRLHRASRRWLAHRLASGFGGPTVVVTHHAPLPPRERIADPLRRALAGAFVSDLTDLMEADRVALWIHGHTHRRVDVAVRGTRVVSNPRGYPHEPVEGFDPGLLLEL
jgi:predicted phosphodiesterase